MPMKLVQLPLHLTPGEAHTLIDFLSQLQDLLWANYGAQIQKTYPAPVPGNASTNVPDFDDPLPF